MRSATTADRGAALNLLRRAHAGDDTAAPTAEEWDWLFARNPTGGDLQYVVAAAEDRLVGQYATVPLRLQLAGGASETEALLSLNTATDPDFQRQGIFSSLAEHLYGAAAGRFALVYGFPNGRSAPGFFKRLGWHDLGRPPLLVRPLRRPSHKLPRPGVGLAFTLVAPALKGLDIVSALGRGGGGVERVDSFGSWADDIWRTIGPGLGTAAVRDQRFLQWRFDNGPREYRRWVTTAQDDSPSGYAVSRLVPWRGMTIAYVMELLATTGGTAGRLLRALLTDAVHEGAVAACAVATKRHPHRGVLLRHGLTPVPARLDQDISFGVRILTPGIADKTVLHRDAWYLSAADFDWV